MSIHNIDAKSILEAEIQKVLTEITKGRVDGVSYDTAWVARLSSRYPSYGFDQSLDWIRNNQYEDGTWGAPLVHYHDRFISTLAAVVALKEVGNHLQDAYRVQRGEDALWKLIGHLGKDNSDTIGFPILSAALAEEAISLGLDVPRPPMRYAAGYKKKIAALFGQTKRDWRTNSISFSLEALRFAMHDEDEVLEENYAVSMSPSATASYLFTHQNEGTLSYLQHVLAQEGSGAIPAVHPIDIFETTWSLNHLRLAGAIEANNPHVRSALDFLWKSWSPVSGVSCSTYFTLPNLDDVASGFSALHWGGYDVKTDVFAQYEYEDHFYCFPNETDPSLGAHVRLLAALKQSNEPERHRLWINKIVGVLERFDQNGTFWWDKWHVSPYYLSSSAVIGLQGIADSLALSRVRWMLKTQNKDGGWGYLGTSTPEETAYCLEALLYWERTVEKVDSEAIDAGARYLETHINDNAFTPMWIGKSLYTPVFPVKAAILGAMFTYINQRD